MQLPMYLCGEQAPHHRQWPQEERVEINYLMLRLLPKPKGLLPKSMRSSPKKMPPSRQLSTATRMSSPRRRFLLPASTFNVHWDSGAQVTRQTTAVLVRRTSFLNYYLVNHYYYNLVPMVPAVNKRFFKSFDLISRQCYLLLKPI